MQQKHSDRNSKKSYRLTVKFDEATHLRLKEIAEKRGLSMSATVRSQIIKWLQKMK